MPKHSLRPALALLAILVLVSSACRDQPPLPPSSAPVATPAAATGLAAVATPAATGAPVTAPPTPAPPAQEYPAVPYELVSPESLFTYLEGLTSIQPYSGWRNSASSGEAEALDYVQARLGDFSNLRGMGLELERQSFSVYLSIEIWGTGLTLTVAGQEVRVPAEGLRGSRWNRQAAAYFDSDGTLDDSNSDPLTATGAPLVVYDEEMLYDLMADELKGRVLFLDYSLLDSFVNSEGYANTARLIEMVDDGLAGVVLVTQDSNTPGESRGTTLGDGAIFSFAAPYTRVPVLHLCLEDLGPAGITTPEGLAQIESAQLMLDADVFSPGQGGNLIARVPGADSSRAVILGAHIDSPNGPGAFDDGSGSAALLKSPPAS